MNPFAGVRSSRPASVISLVAANLLPLAGVIAFGWDAISFVFDWIIGGESATANPIAEMRAPLRRTVVLHLTIIGGGIAGSLVGDPGWARVALVAIKTGLDLRGHLEERREAGERTASGAPA